MLNYGVLLRPCSPGLALLPGLTEPPRGSGVLDTNLAPGGALGSFVLEILSSWALPSAPSTTPPGPSLEGWENPGGG